MGKKRLLCRQEGLLYQSKGRRYRLGVSCDVKWVFFIGQMTSYINHGAYHVSGILHPVTEDLLYSIH